MAQKNSKSFKNSFDRVLSRRLLKFLRPTFQSTNPSSEESEASVRVFDLQHPNSFPYCRRARCRRHHDSFY